MSVRIMAKLSVVTSHALNVVSDLLLLCSCLDCVSMYTGSGLQRIRLERQPSYDDISFKQNH